MAFLLFCFCISGVLIFVLSLTHFLQNQTISWLYDVIVGIFKDKIKDAFQSALNDQFKVALNSVISEYSKQIPTDYRISSHLGVNYALMHDPIVTDQVVYVTPGTGRFYAYSGKQCESYTTILHPYFFGERWITFSFSQDMAQCLGFLLQQSGILNINITNSIVPSDSPVQLNTSNANIKKILPNLAKLYPNEALEINIFVSATPTTIITNSIAVSLPVTAVVFAINSTNQQKDSVFTLDIEYNITARIDLDSQKVFGNLDQTSFNASLNSSAIGPIDMQGVVELIDLANSFAIQPQITHYLTQGIPFPELHGISLVSPHTLYTRGVVHVSSNFNYTPPFDPISF